MNCDEAMELYPEYREERLTPDQARDIERHVTACARCRAEAKDADALMQAAAALPRQTAGTEVLLRIREATHGRTSAPARRTDFGPVMDLDELAEFLRTDKERVASYLNEIPCFELGGQLLFRRQSVEAWLAAREASFGQTVVNIAWERKGAALALQGGLS